MLVVPGAGQADALSRDTVVTIGSTRTSVPSTALDSYSNPVVVHCVDSWCSGDARSDEILGAFPGQPIGMEYDLQLDSVGLTSAIAGRVPHSGWPAATRSSPSEGPAAHSTSRGATTRTASRCPAWWV